MVSGITNLSVGKFFEMPKGMKPAPPQQSSLKELWNGKGKKQRVEVEKVEKGEDPNGMDIDEGD